MICDREALAYRVVLTVLAVFLSGYVTGCIRTEGGPESGHEQEIRKKKDEIILRKLEREVKE